MGVSATNVSFHLKELERSGLINQQRVSRSIIYRASFETLAELVTFLMEDCCAGLPRSGITSRCPKVVGLLQE